MSHELFYVQQQSHQALIFILVGGGVGTVIIVALTLYWHWKGRHAREAAQVAPERRKMDRRRRKR